MTKQQLTETIKRNCKNSKKIIANIDETENAFVIYFTMGATLSETLDTIKDVEQQGATILARMGNAFIYIAKDTTN